MRGLEIGGETSPAYPDYDQVDNVPDFGATIICDAMHLATIRSDLYDHVYARNVLEHFSWHDTSLVLINWFRVTKPGGRLEIIVPDTLGIIQHYCAGIDKWEHTVERLAGTQNYPGNTHKAFFTLNEFADVLIEAIPVASSWTVDSTHNGAGITATIYK